jgi:cysteine desulfurase
MMHYMDHNATTPLAPEVFEAMLPYWQTCFANPSSLHHLGQQARHAVETSRERIAALTGSQPSQVIFTSGGTEANNLFIQGSTAWQAPGHIWRSPYEHPCIQEPIKALTRQGWKHHTLPATPSGSLDLEQWNPDPLTLKGALVSVMTVNNETGVILPVRAVAERCRAAGAWVHTDAVQAAGKYPITMKELGVDALTLSAHKVYGPKGIGALIVNKRLDIRPLLLGGGHEQGRRSGTEAVPLIVGLAVALELAEQRRKEWNETMRPLQLQLETGLRTLEAHIFGQEADRVANTSYFGFTGIHGDSLVMALDQQGNEAEGFAVSSGSACSSHHPGPSTTLLAMGYDKTTAETAVRISLGWSNTPASIDALLARLKRALMTLRSISGQRAL